MAQYSFKLAKVVLGTLIFMLIAGVPYVYASTTSQSSSIPSKLVPSVVERTFVEAFGRQITAVESDYWKQRARTDKTTESALKGAMAFQKSKGGTMPLKSTSFINCVVEGKTYVGTKEECSLLKELVESNNTFNAKHQAFLNEFDNNMVAINEQALSSTTAIKKAGTNDTSVYNQQVNKRVSDFNKKAKQDVTKLAKQLDKNRCKPQTGTALPPQCQYGK